MVSGPFAFSRASVLVCNMHEKVRDPTLPGMSTRRFDAPVSFVAEAQERADQDARREAMAGPPRGSLTADAEVSDCGCQAPREDERLPGESVIDAAHRRADAEARKAYVAGPPSCAMVRR